MLPSVSQLVKGNWTSIQNVKNSRRQVSTEVTFGIYTKIPPFKVEMCGKV